MIRIETSVGAVSAVAVVGLPGGVGGLEQDVGAARVVAHDEVDVARAWFAQRDAKPPAEGTVGVRDRLGAGSGWGERMVGAPGGRDARDRHGGGAGDLHRIGTLSGRPRSDAPAREVPPVSIQLGRFASASRMRSRSISASNSGASSPTMRALRMAS